MAHWRPLHRSLLALALALGVTMAPRDGHASAAEGSAASGGAGEASGEPARAGEQPAEGTAARSRPGEHAPGERVRIEPASGEPLFSERPPADPPAEHAPPGHAEDEPPSPRQPGELRADDAGRGALPEVAGDGALPEAVDDGALPEVAGDGALPEAVDDDALPEVAGDGALPEEDAALPEVGEAVVRGAPRPQAAAALAPGAAVTVIDAQRYAGEAKGAAELLVASPGVAVSEHGGIGSYATVSIRGSSAEEVKVLLDGIPINPSAGGGVDLSSIPPQWISRIEVVRGTEGVHHGSGALGGVVNVVTAVPRGKLWSAGATGGSFDTWQADAQLGAGGATWGLLGAFAASASSGRFPYRYEDGDVTSPDDLVRTNNASALGGALLKAFVLAGGGRLDAAAQLSGGRRDLPGSRLDPQADDWQEEARGLLSARFRRPGPAGATLSLGASTRIDRLDLRLEDLGGVVTRQRGLAAKVSAGAEWAGSPGSLTTQVEGGAERLVADGMDEHTRPEVALSLSGKLNALRGRLAMGPGVRIERTGEHAGFSAKLGATLRLFGPLSLRASGGRTYRVPSFAELYLQQGVIEPNPDLLPEIGVGGDAGIVVEGRLGTASAGVFSTLYDDLVVYQPVSFRRFSPRNDARAVIRGVEAELATPPLRRLAGLSMGLAYTFTDSETLLGPVDVVGKDVPRQPRHRIHGRLGMGGTVAEVHAETEWISRYYFDLRNSATVPAAFTIGAGGSVLLRRAGSVRLNVEVRNLLDDRSLQDGFENPLPGRTVLVTLRAGSHERPR